MRPGVDGLQVGVLLVDVKTFAGGPDTGRLDTGHGVRHFTVVHAAMALVICARRALFPQVEHVVHQGGKRVREDQDQKADGLLFCDAVTEADQPQQGVDGD